MGSFLHSSVAAQYYNMDTNFLQSDSKLQPTVAHTQTSLVVMAGSDNGDYFKVSYHTHVVIILI